MQYAQAFAEDLELFTPQQRKPEERLLVAILSRAIHDFIGNDHLAKRDAIQYILRRQKGEPKPWTFLWCCQHVNLHPAFIMDLVHKYRDHPDAKAAFSEELGIVDFHYTARRTCAR